MSEGRASFLHQHAPASPSELTSEWLRQALGLATLEGFDLEVIGASTGLTGRLARLRLRGASEGAPASVIAKFGAEEGPTRQLALRFDLYEREARFYETLAPRCGVGTPKLYYASPPGRPFALVLEDLQGIEGDLTAGSSLEQAERLLLLLAGMHARFWNSSELTGLPWLPTPDNKVILDLSEESSARSWQLFKSQFGVHMPEPLRELGEGLSRDRSLLHRLAAPPWTLVHGDMRNNNAMFRADRPDEPLAIFDWQTAMRGRGPIDVASVLATSLSEADRRTAERELIPAYHARLLELGVNDYSLDECRRDYRLSVANLFSQVIALNALIDVNARIEDDHAQATGARLISALLDLDVDEIVPPTGLKRYAKAAKRVVPAPLRRARRRLLGRLTGS